MKGGMNAALIMAEYKREQAYKNKQREKCKEQNCGECKYEEICVEEKNEANSIS